MSAAVEPGRLRGADADEVHVAELGGLLQGRGEPQPAGVDVLARAVRESRFVERRVAFGEPIDLRGVDVHSEDVVAELGHAGCMYGAEVACSNNGDAHGDLLRWRMRILTGRILDEGLGIGIQASLAMAGL